MSGGLKEAHKGQQTKACTNASQKPLKSMVHFSITGKISLFLCDFPISSIFCM